MKGEHAITSFKAIGCCPQCGKLINGNERTLKARQRVHLKVCQGARNLSVGCQAELLRIRYSAQHDPAAKEIPYFVQVDV